jgi:hypothetical protein
VTLSGNGRPRSLRSGVLLLLLSLLSGAGAWAGDQTEKVRNEKVRVVEQTLAPAEALSLTEGRAGVVILLDAGSIETAPARAENRTRTVKRGETVLLPPGTGGVKNTGISALRIVWTEYLGKGSSETWGVSGLAPHYRLLFEDRYGRVYDIQIPAGTSELLHSHHDRVVVCLSGAELMHEMPDGRKEASSLKTGDIAWRRAATHVGHNLGKTDLWVIAIEPK